MIAAVVVPLYRATLGETDSIALAQCCSVLRRHDLKFVAPEGLDVTTALRIAREAGAGAGVERFAPEWFKSTGTYNALLLSTPFYERFAAYDYILVHQLDAFVFADQLERFCALGYDYIGAPWLHDAGGSRYVGNGGFSLRKVESALRVLALHASFAPSRLALAWRRHALLRSGIVGFFERRRRLDRIMQSGTYLPLSLAHLMFVNEDGFWGQNCDKLPFFNTAPYEEALDFAFETDPHTALAKNGGRLPFGCHAWPREPGFWRTHINALGYEWDGAS